MTIEYQLTIDCAAPGRNSTGNVSTRLPSRCGPGPLIRARRRSRRPRALPPARGQSRPEDRPLQSGGGSRLPWRAAPIAFSAAFRNPSLGYRWNFGDPVSGAANRASGSSAAHAFTAPGTYTVTLELRDGGTLIATRRGTIALL